MSTPIKLRKNPELLGELWAAIEHASHSAREKKLEHERLQIDIRKASIARLLGYPMAAEAILEHVGLDLARHSGAEILFREFQIESAETLLALERPRYAFVAYAWPAYQALRNRSAKLLIRKCRRLCRKLLLSAIPLTANEPKPDLKSNRFWREVEKTVDVNLYPFFSVDLLPTGEDVERYFQELAIEENRAKYVDILIE